MFWLGALPALLALYIRTKVPESEAWREHRVGTLREVGTELRGHARGFAYVVLLMTFMMFLSHGTQDLYPDFLKHEHHVAATTVPWIAILYNVGAVIGAVIFGQLSQHIGRRYSMIAALSLSLCVMPFWAFGSSLMVLAIGAFLMQAGEQGAWGIKSPCTSTSSLPTASGDSSPASDISSESSSRRRPVRSRTHCAIASAIRGRWPASSSWSSSA